MRSHSQRLLVATTLLTACTHDAADLLRPNATPGITVAAVSASDWSPARSIEEARPGASPGFNTPVLEGCPFVSPDNKTFYLASNRGGTGLDIWVSERDRVDEPWGDPVSVGAPVNSSADDFCPTIARDGHTFYFVSRRQVGVAGVDYCGGSDIYVTRRRDANRGFDEPKNLGCQVNSPQDEFGPFPIEEPGVGLVLYFSSTRPGVGIGGDLYRSQSHGGVFGPPTLVPGVNSTSDDGQPNLSRDGLELYFYSNRPIPGVPTNNDIYVTTRSSTSEPWSTPVNLGPDVNNGANETRPSLSWDGSTLYFGSNRPGSEPLNGTPSSDIYVTTRSLRHGPKN